MRAGRVPVIPQPSRRSHHNSDRSQIASGIVPPMRLWLKHKDSNRRRLPMASGKGEVKSAQWLRSMVFKNVSDQSSSGMVPVRGLFLSIIHRKRPHRPILHGISPPMLLLLRMIVSRCGKLNNSAGRVPLRLLNDRNIPHTLPSSFTWTPSHSDSGWSVSQLVLFFQLSAKPNR